MKFQHKPHDICELSSDFGPRDLARSPYHYGIDIRGRVHGVAGDSCYAVADGVVRMLSYDGDGYGYYLIIEHTQDKAFCTLYGHLKDRVVKVGDKVTAGQIVGHMGNTGAISTGVHLHFEMRVTSYLNFWYTKSVCVDPYPYIKGVDTKVEVKVLDNTPDDYAKSAVVKAINSGLLKGDLEGNFNLHKTITRQEVLVLFERLGLLK